MKIDAQQQKAILDRFNDDEGFRKRALEDPNKAVKEEFGIDLPFPMRLREEEAGYRIEPVLGTTDDLTDDQLELASGGKGGAPINVGKVNIPRPPSGLIPCGGGNAPW